MEEVRGVRQARGKTRLRTKPIPMDLLLVNRSGSENDEVSGRRRVKEGGGAKRRKSGTCVMTVELQIGQSIRN